MFAFDLSCFKLRIFGYYLFYYLQYSFVSCLVFVFKCLCHVTLRLFCLILSLPPSVSLSDLVQMCVGPQVSPPKAHPKQYPDLMAIIYEINNQM